MNDNEQCRRVLQGVLLGDDRAPADRIKAAELLRQMEGAGPDLSFDAELRAMPDHLLDAELDSMLIADVASAVILGEPVNGVEPSAWPATAAAVEHAVEQLVAEKAAKLLEVEERNRGIEARAEQHPRLEGRTRSSF